MADRRALILSLGGSPEPLIVSIREHRPEWVCFFASTGTEGVVLRVLEGLDAPVAHAVVTVERPEDIPHCYERALGCFDRATQGGFATEELRADITGGTKVMSTALTLAAMARGVHQLFYVGGTERDKGGLGAVIAGSEQVLAQLNPWRLFAVDERRRAVDLFDEGRYSTAGRLFQDLTQRLPQEPSFRWFRLAAEGLAAWDRFQHAPALHNLVQLKVEFERLNTHGLDDFRAGLAGAVTFLNELASGTQTFTLLHPLLVADLVANASRRIDDARFDDAMARLYRAVEMFIQCEIQRTFGFPSERFPLERIPERLRNALRRRNPDGPVVQLTEREAYRILAESAQWKAQHPWDKSLEDLRTLRNNSILAHGQKPIKAKAAKAMREFVLAWLPEAARRPIAFPKIGPAQPETSGGLPAQGGLDHGVVALEEVLEDLRVDGEAGEDLTQERVEASGV